MSVVEDLADRLARDAIEAAELMGDDTLITAIAESMSTSSTTEEAFLTAVRVRLAEKRGRKLLEAKIDAFEAKLKNPG
ncbi:hypothetical protein Q4577_18000 [Marinovum sp. 2_MG-2023]|uniref:hypothetical protein n=1 Tax=Roseobacteraceae TaxID=2854170 RepID=UPI001FD29585|nr:MULTISPECIES: hypothetical protein [Roseobacteraceae]MCJ7875085.1 hypothetical protein [Phaeobacter sp. J2-8]MDO6731928.1 hypothetical protein [Marinovum sp. 2_MG-2023]MDO6781180.1 hypothetical protein [Marinovum sp. 1_MG-2023]